MLYMSNKKSLSILNLSFVSDFFCAQIDKSLNYDNKILLYQMYNGINKEEQSKIQTDVINSNDGAWNITKSQI